MKTAHEFLQESIVIDTHLDLLTDLDNKHRAGRTDVIREDYLADLKAGCVDVIVSAVYVGPDDLPERGLKRVFDQISAL